MVRTERVVLASQEHLRALRAAEAGLGASSDSGRIQHLTLSSYQSWFWCPTLENHSPPYSEICPKPGKDDKTKQSHLPCSWQPDLDGYQCRWEYWPSASPTRLEADGEVPRNSMLTSAPLCPQPSLEQGQHSTASTEAGGTRTLSAQGVFSRLWKRRGNKETVCSIQEQTTAAEKQHSLSCLLAMKSATCKRISPVQEYQCPARRFSSQPSPRIAQPEGLQLPPSTDFCSVLTHWQLQTAKPSQYYTRPHASRS